MNCKKQDFLKTTKKGFLKRILGFFGEDRGFVKLKKRIILKKGFFSIKKGFLKNYLKKYVL